MANARHYQCSKSDMDAMLRFSPWTAVSLFIQLERSQYRAEMAERTASSLHVFSSDLQDRAASGKANTTSLDQLGNERSRFSELRYARICYSWKQLLSGDFIPSHPII